MPTGPPAQLTGLRVPEDQAARLLGPALAVKIDNSADAMPHAGLNDADVVVELRVEGISRLMGVYHGRDATLLGPVRSARASDPEVLALFGEPLFGWSGANTGVTTLLAAVPWIRNVPPNVAPGAYWRGGGRRSPHNLFTDTTRLFPLAAPGQLPPSQLWSRLEPGEVPVGGTPVAGASVTVGSTRSSWVWNGSDAWLRWQYGRAHRLTDGSQVTAANVVVIDTVYTGGSSHPVSTTTGSGRATVFVAGTMIDALWSRADRTVGYTLVDTAGRPIRLSVGRTWIELPSGHAVSAMSPSAASGLLAGTG